LFGLSSVFSRFRLLFLLVSWFFFVLLSSLSPDERRARAQKIVCSHALGGTLLLAGQLLDPLKRKAIQPVRAAQPISE